MFNKLTKSVEIYSIRLHDTPANQVRLAKGVHIMNLNTTFNKLNPMLNLIQRTFKDPTGKRDLTISAKPMGKFKTHRSRINFWFNNTLTQGK